MSSMVSGAAPLRNCFTKIPCVTEFCELLALPSVVLGPVERWAFCRLAIHEKLTRIPKQLLRQVGWNKAIELVKVVRREGESFDSATWLHQAKEMPKEGFKNEVQRHFTGKETEPWEIIYLKLYKSQIPVVEKALETAALMLGTDRSRGYCLEMICADFLAGANLGENQP